MAITSQYRTRSDALPLRSFKTKGRPSAIAGVGAFAPEKIITNFDLEKMMDTSDKWITERTGIHRRHIAEPGTTTLELATKAARSALAAAGHGRPPKSFGKGDYGILNYALTLEYLEAAFYNGATAANLSLTPQAAAFLKIVTRDENAHVAFLKTALGKKAVAEPKFDFKGANTSVETFMKTAQVLENTGVHAYLGQVTNIEHAKYVKAAGSKVKGIVIPANIDASTEYPIAALSKAANSVGAKAFVAYVLSPAAQTVLAAAGFEQP